MCGIVGYVGQKECQEFLLQGLRRLEYRGYEDRKSTRLNSSHPSIYTLSLHDALPICSRARPDFGPFFAPLPCPSCAMFESRLGLAAWSSLGGFFACAESSDMSVKRNARSSCCRGCADWSIAATKIGRAHV